MVKTLPPAVAALQSSIEHIASDLHNLDSTLRNRSADCDIAAEQVTLLQEKVGCHTALLEANAVFQCEILDRLAALEKTSSVHNSALATHDARIAELSECDNTLDKAIRRNAQWQTDNLNHLLRTSQSSTWARNFDFNILDTLVQSLRTRVVDLEKITVVPNASFNHNDGSNNFEEHPSPKVSASASPFSNAMFASHSGHVPVEISHATWDKLTTRVITLEDAALASDESACIAIKRLSARLRSLGEEVEENRDECNNNERVAIDDLSTRMTHLEKTTEASIERLDDETAALDADVLMLEDAGLTSDKSACMAIKRLSARIGSLKEEVEKQKDECNDNKRAAVDGLVARISSLEETIVADIECLRNQVAALVPSLRSTNDPLVSTTARTDEMKVSVGMAKDSSSDSQIQDLKALTEDLDALGQELCFKVGKFVHNAHANNHLLDRVGALEEKNFNKQLMDLENPIIVVDHDLGRRRHVVALEDNNHDEQIKELKTVTDATEEGHNRLMDRAGALEGNDYHEQLKSLRVVTNATQDDHSRLMNRVGALEDSQKNCSAQLDALEAVTTAAKEDHDRRIRALEDNKYDDRLKCLEAVNNATKVRLDACDKLVKGGGPIYTAHQNLRSRVSKIEGDDYNEQLKSLKHKYDEQLDSLKAVTDSTQDHLEKCETAITIRGPTKASFEQLSDRIEKLELENCSERIEKFSEETVVRIRALEDQDSDERITRLENNPGNWVGAGEEGEEGFDDDDGVDYGSGCSDVGC